MDLVREMVMASGLVMWKDLDWRCRLLRMLRKHWRKVTELRQMLEREKAKNLWELNCTAC